MTIEEFSRCYPMGFNEYGVLQIGRELEDMMDLITLMKCVGARKLTIIPINNKNGALVDENGLGDALITNFQGYVIDVHIKNISNILRIEERHPKLFAEAKKIVDG